MSKSNDKCDVWTETGIQSGNCRDSCVLSVLSARLWCSVVGCGLCTAVWPRLVCTPLAPVLALNKDFRRFDSKFACAREQRFALSKFASIRIPQKKILVKAVRANWRQLPSCSLTVTGDAVCGTGCVCAVELEARGGRVDPVAYVLSRKAVKPYLEISLVCGGTCGVHRVRSLRCGSRHVRAQRHTTPREGRHTPHCGLCSHLPVPRSQSAEAEVFIIHLSSFMFEHLRHAAYSCECG